MNINCIKYTENGMEYIGNTELDEKDFKKTMEEICETNNISMFWHVKTDGEFFISIDLCEAKICSGTYDKH